MRYEQNVTQKIVYSYEDLLIWLRTFAARQFDVNPETISDEDIILNGVSKDCEITVNHIKITSNQREEKVDDSNPAYQGDIGHSNIINIRPIT